MNACSAAFEASLSAAIAAAASEDVASDARRQAVRQMLRHGKYKPSGRGKPASEYLWQAAREGDFPRVQPLVDVCNLASLRSGLPISLIDLTRAGAVDFVIRRGAEKESYVFNAGGQTIDLTDLLLLARASDNAPLANAVKDSLATKLTPESNMLLGVVYAPASAANEAEAAAKEMSEWFARDFAAEAAVARMA